MGALVIAGSAGAERDPPVPGSDPAWYEPLHVRAAAHARQDLAARVSAGADAIVAPTWLTHRRALVQVGESRRSREWTEAAVRLAREAAEEGASDRDPAAPVVVAGVLPRLKGGDDPTPGRRPSVSATRSADVHQIVGMLADAASDAILVEDQADAAGWTEAVTAALASGTRTWAVVEASRADDAVMLDALASCLSMGPLELLMGIEASVEPDTAQRTLIELATAAGAIPGVWLRGALAAGSAEALVRGCLETGAWAMGLADDATPESVAVTRTAVDAVEADKQSETEARDAAWLDQLASATHRASGGRALWLGDRVPTRLPEGFRWTVAPLSDIAHLPARAFRFAAVDTPGAELRPIAPLLDDGGVIAARGPAPGFPAEMEVLDVMEGPTVDGMVIVARVRRR